MIPVNGKQLGYRIGSSDREIGSETPASDGFVVLNQSESKIFEAQNGVWTEAQSFPQDLLAAWYGNYYVSGGTPSWDEAKIGFRIGLTDREVGADCNAPEGFLVYNSTNGKCFKSSSGKWADGGVFPQELLSAWAGC